MNTSFLATVLIVLMILLIVSSLGMGLYYLVRDQGKSKRTVKALSVRIVLSFVLFIALFVAFAMGWLTPHGLFAQ